MKWPIMRLLFTSLTPFLVVLWVAFLVVVGGIIVAISIWGTMRSSVWDQAASQIPRWLAAGLGYNLVHSILPVVVSHGRTRREFMVQAGAFSVVLAATMALLISAGFGLESLLYSAMDWPHVLQKQQSFSSPTDFGTIFLAYWLMFAVWTGVGAMIAAGFDRLQGGGFGTFLLGLGLIIPAGTAVAGSNGLPFVGPLLGSGSSSIALAGLLCLGSCLISLTVTWALVREMPVRAKA